MPKPQLDLDPKLFFTTVCPIKNYVGFFSFPLNVYLHPSVKFNLLDLLSTKYGVKAAKQQAARQSAPFLCALF